MPLKTMCPQCGKGLQVPDAAMGKRVKCPACTHAWQIPRSMFAATEPEMPQKGAWFDELMSDTLPSAAQPAAPVATPSAAPRRGPSGSLASCCTLQGATISVSFDAADVTQRITKKLEKRLGKKGMSLFWTNEMDSPELVIRVVRIDQGNQLLRYLVHFLGAAVVEVEGQVAIGGSGPRPFHFTQKAHFGFFGGSARGMLNVCADRIGDKIARFVVKASRLERNRI
jgi:hypothetical protein